MGVRIRLAYHPLARRKEPYYHIVAARSKYCLLGSTPPAIANYLARTARQKKPLEVLGTYDPIPRHPQGSSGQILQDEPKVKKISMNVDRIKYWLSVGAQPSSHMARLLRKVSPLVILSQFVNCQANLIPEEPSIQEKKKPLPLNNAISKKARDVWARQKQVIKEENKRVFGAPNQNAKKPEKPVILPSTGAHLQDQVADVAHDLVGEVLRESLYKETIAIPGKPFLDRSIELKSSNQLRKDYKEWLEWICPGDRKPQLVEQFQILLKPCRERTMPLRFFTAFFHLKKDLGERHNGARFNLLIEWLDSHPVEQLQVYERESLDNFLWKMFHQWHDAMISIGSKRVLTEEEATLSQIISNRLECIHQGIRSFKGQEREWHPWKRLFKMDLDAINSADGLDPGTDTTWIKYFKKHANEVPADYFEKLREMDPSIVDTLLADTEVAEGLDPDNNDKKVFEEALKRLREEEENKKAAREAKKEAGKEMRRQQKLQRKAKKG